MIHTHTAHAWSDITGSHSSFMNCTTQWKLQPTLRHTQSAATWMQIRPRGLEAVVISLCRYLVYGCFGCMVHILACKKNTFLLWSISLESKNSFVSVFNTIALTTVLITQPYCSVRGLTWKLTCHFLVFNSCQSKKDLPAKLDSNFVSFLRDCASTRPCSYSSSPEQMCSAGCRANTMGMEINPHVILPLKLKTGHL